MEHYAGIDVSLKESNVCVVNSSGKIVHEAKVASEPEALLRHFADLEIAVSRIGLEAGPLSQWLHGSLVEAVVSRIFRSAPGDWQGARGASPRR